MNRPALRETCRRTGAAWWASACAGMIGLGLLSACAGSLLPKPAVQPALFALDDSAALAPQAAAQCDGFIHAAAAAGKSPHTQRESQFSRDMAGVFRQDVEGSGTHVAESDNPHVDGLHSLYLTIVEEKFGVERALGVPCRYFSDTQKLSSKARHGPTAPVSGRVGRLDLRRRGRMKRGITHPGGCLAATRRGAAKRHPRAFDIRARE